MLTGIHFLLTYKCIYECDHCFVYSSPMSEGTFTFEQVCRVLDEAEKIGTVEWIYFEGGEPFLYYPLLLESVKNASARGFKVGIVSNAYFATSVEDAQNWLKPFRELNIADLSISNDQLHSGNNINSPALIAITAAKNLGINLSSISIEKPEIKCDAKPRKKGEPVVGGDVMFKGRAADKLTGNLPGVDWFEFNSCPFEELENPERLHVDAYGNVQICQGISIGNMRRNPLSDLVKNYNAELHPITCFLAHGGPVKLASEYNISHSETYLDACHFCYETRKKLIDKYPQYLAPKQVYGL